MIIRSSIPKLIATLALVVALLAVILPAATADLASVPGILDGLDPTLAILTPVADDTFVFHQPLIVSWNTTDHSFGDTPMRIEYYSLDGNPDGIASPGTSADLPFAWDLQAIPTGHYYLTVTASDSFGNHITVNSAVFFIIGPNPDSDWYVTPAGDDYYGNGSPAFPLATIQRALDLCQSGHTLHIHDGVYPEDLDTYGKAVQILSVGSAQTTIIQGSGTRSIVRLNGNARLSGVTIMNSALPDTAAAIVTGYGAPVLEFCRISTNAHGVRIGEGATPYLHHNLIQDGLTLIGCDAAAQIRLENNHLLNGQTGIRLNNPAAELTAINNIITGHTLGGGLQVSGATAGLHVHCNLFWNNLPADLVGAPDSLWELGNFSADPLFINPAADDFHLQPGSPAIDAGDPAFAFDLEPEPNGDRINIGRYGNTAEAASAHLRFTSDLILMTLEDSLYRQPTGILPDNGVQFTFHQLYLPGWLSLEADYSAISGVPDNSHVGADSIIIAVEDNFARTDTLAYLLTIINQPPVFTSQPDTVTLEDELYLYDADCSDDGQGIIRYTLLQPAWLSIDSLSGVVSGIPTNDEVGEHTVILSVSDGNGGEAVQEYTLRVENVNDPPVLSALPAQSIPEDEVLALPVTALQPFVTDVDHPVTSLIWSALANAHFQTEARLDTLFIAPLADWFGVDSLMIIVSDGELADSAWLTVTVTPVNDPPVWDMAPTLTINSTDSLRLDLKLQVNDIDDPLDSLRFELALAFDSTGTGIQIGLLSGRILRIRPALTSELESGLLRLSVTDTSEATIIHDLYLTIHKINFPPVLDALPTVSGREEQPLAVEINWLKQYVTDPDDPIESLGWILFGTDNIAVTSFTDYFVLHPVTDWFGEDALKIRVFDEQDTTTGYLPVYFANINDPPQLTLPSIFYVNEDETLRVRLADLVDDSDSPVDELLWQVALQPLSRSLTGDPKRLITAASPRTDCLNALIDTATRELVLFGNPDCYVDSVTVYYRVTDDSGAVAIDSNWVTILPVNDPPVVPPLFSLSEPFYEDHTAHFIPDRYFHLVSDVETPVYELHWDVVSSAHILVTASALRDTFFLQPYPDWFGHDTLRVSVNDGEDTSWSRLALEVLAQNDPPRIQLQTYFVMDEDDSLTIDLGAAVTDVDSPDSTLIWQIRSSADSLVRVIHYEAQGLLRLIGQPDQFGDNILIHLRVTDDHAASDSLTIVLDILPVNDAPRFTAALDTSFAEDTEFKISRTEFLNKIIDVDDPIQSLDASLRKISGVVFFDYNPDSLRYRFWSNQDVVGSARFRLIVTDPHGATAETEFTITITPVNDPPVFTVIPDTTAPQDSLFCLSLAPYVLDPDDSLHTLRWTFTTRISSLFSVQTSDTLKILPPEGYTGWDTVSVNVMDTSGTGAQTAFRIKFRDTIPPSFTIGVFQNPIASKHIDIYFFPNEVIDTVLAASVQIISNPANPDSSIATIAKSVTRLTTIEPNPYFCHHILNLPTNVSVKTIAAITAVDTSQNTGVTRYDFSAVELPALSGGLAMSPDQSVRLFIPPRALTHDCMILGLPGVEPSLRANTDFPLSLAKTGSVSANSVTIGFITPDRQLQRHAKIEFDGPPDLIAANGWPGIFILGHNGWRHLPTYTDQSGRRFWAYTDEIGLFKLAPEAPAPPQLLTSQFYLAPNYPNPFNPLTTIEFSLPEFDAVSFDQPARLAVYDLLGRQVTILLDQPCPPGHYRIHFDSRNSAGQSLASGVYFYRLSYGRFNQTRKMVIVK